MVLSPDWHVTVGPPGTGKTSTLVNRFDEEIRRGTPPYRIAYVSFTKSAKIEVIKRLSAKFSLTPNDCCWVRTIHSTAYRLLGIQHDEVMSSKHWREFAKANAFDLSEMKTCRDMDEIDSEFVVMPERTDDDRIRFIYNWGRSLLLSPEQTMKKYPGGYFDTSKFRRFYTEIIQYKREKKLVDFTDMLEMALRTDDRPGADIAFIDEAQDLSPLQQALCEKWFANCERVFIAGDDDQAIFSFQGANPDWLLKLANICETQILTQSYRVPVAVHAEAAEIIRRNRNRIVKQYHPTSEKGSVEFLQIRDAIRGINGESVFILGRNWFVLEDAAKELFNSRIPYLLERGIYGVPNPYYASGSMMAVKTILAIAQGRRVSAGDLYATLKKIPSKGVNKRRFLPNGVKTRVKNLNSEKKLGTMDLIDMDLVDLVDTVSSEDNPLSVLSGLHRDFLDYCRDVIAKHGKLPEPNIRLMSMHRSKGQEADKVIVVPDMSKKTYLGFALGGKDGGFEAENRVAYVAVTRAKKQCVIAFPSSRRYYDYPRKSGSMIY